MSASPLLRLLRYARPHRRAMGLATLCSVLNKVFDLAPPVLIGAAVDIVVSRQSSILARWGFPDVDTQLWILAGVTFLIWALESLFEYLYQLGWRRLAQRVQHQLRVEAYAHVQTLELSYFEGRSTGGLVSILNDDINQLERFLDDGANQLLQVVTTVLVVGGIFIGIVPAVSWMALLPMPLVIWGSLWYQRKLEPRYAEVRAEVGNLAGHLTGNISGMATIKSFVAEDHEVARIEAASRAYEEVNRAAITLSSAFVPLIRMIIVVGFAAIMVYGGKMVLAGELNVGAYSVLVFMTQRLLWPLTRLGGMLDQYQRAMASTTRVLDLLGTRRGIPSGDRPLPGDAVRGAIEIEDLHFRYREGPWVLRGLNATIEAGRTTAFVGATGSGKSTLVKLLLRFYDFERGRITLDGVNITELRTSDLRAAVGLVSQDVFLFDGTIHDNIRYGSFDATEEEIIQAARTAEIHDFIASLPQGYETRVGERGQKLSGGQRQRLSIARAILKDPPVLILDEATSSVDNDTEAAIQRSLERVAVGRTIIAIAHRLSTVRHAHRTYVLADGAVAESGDHQDLVAKGGIYAGLWKVQTGEAAA